MAHNRYSMPTAKERRLLLLLEASEERCASLLADSTDTSAIASLDARIAGLTAKLAEKDKTVNSLKAKCGNLVDRSKALSKERAALKKGSVTA